MGTAVSIGTGETEGSVSVAAHQLLRLSLQEFPVDVGELLEELFEFLMAFDHLADLWDKCFADMPCLGDLIDFEGEIET